MVLSICLLLVGCLSPRFIYNQMDWAIVWYLDGFFSLNAEQKEQLREAVDRNMEWHRREQLPHYAEFCHALERDTAGSITPEMLEKRWNEMLRLWDEFLVHAMPDAAAFFLSLDEQQIEDFLEKMDVENEELWDEYAGETAEQRLDRRQKVAVKNFQRVIGRLTGEQKDFIRASMANLHDIANEWLESRRQWQVEFYELIASRPSEPEFSERLTYLMLNPNKYDSDDYRRKVDENRQMVFVMFSQLVDQMTDKQRDRLRKRLDDFAKDFEFLAMQK